MHICPNTRPSFVSRAPGNIFALHSPEKMPKNTHTLTCQPPSFFTRLIFHSSLDHISVTANRARTDANRAACVDAGAAAALVRTLASGALVSSAGGGTGLDLIGPHCAALDELAQCTDVREGMGVNMQPIDRRANYYFSKSPLFQLVQSKHFSGQISAILFLFLGGKFEQKISTSYLLVPMIELFRALPSPRPQRTPQLLAAGVSRALVRCMRLVPRNVEQLRYGDDGLAR